MRKGLIIVGASCVAVAGATLLVSHLGPSRVASKHAASADASGARPAFTSAGVAASRPSAWRAGAQHRYSLAARVGFGDAASEGSTAGASWSGTLAATVLEVSPTQVSIAYSLESARFVTTRADSSSQQLAPMERQLALPFAATYDASGRLVQTRLSRALTADAEPLVRSLLSQMQFSLPSEDGARSWQAGELDGTGEYLAAYARLDESGNYSKQKLKYLRVMGRVGLVTQGAEAHTIVSSRATFSMGSDGRLARLRLQEVAGLNAMGNNPGSESQFRVRSELSLELQGSSEISLTSLQASLADLVASDVGVTAVSAGVASNLQGDRALVAGASVRSLVDELLRLPRDASKERAAIQGRLAALLRLDARAIGEVTELIRGGNPDNPLLIAALAGAGTAEAQTALVDLALDDGLDKAAREQVLANLAAIDEPNAQTAERLRPLLSNADPEVRAQAGLAMGSAARGISATAPDAARAATADLVKQLSRSTSEEEKLWAVRSLGNAGSADALGPLSEALGSSIPSMREAAAQSLRFIPGPEADALISHAITSDTSADVRGAALFAARFREPEAVVASVERSARADSSEMVRQQAIQTLGRIARESNAPLETLDFVAKNDASPQNRETAQRILETLPPPSDP